MYPIAIAFSLFHYLRNLFLKYGYISIIGVAVSAYHIFLQNGGGSEEEHVQLMFHVI